MLSKLSQLLELGQSIWIDFIRRSFITSGEMQKLVDQGVRGMTSNPTIFEKAISGSSDYDAEMHSLIAAGKSIQEIYEALAISDIRLAADILRPVFEESNGQDGFVSLEVNPNLAHDTAGTTTEVRRLFEAVNRPNLMVKIPATPAGIPAIEASISHGINVNVTLIFSLAQYQAVANAYLAGLERLASDGGKLSRVASVASFFVSRVDTLVDAELEKRGVRNLQGKTAVANSKLAYACFRELFSGRRWEKLAEQGARYQRPLWASTSTKNPAYSDTLYIEPLIGPHTVNTLPRAALDALLDHGTVGLTVEKDLEQAQAHMQRLAEAGLDMGAVTQKLQDDGVKAFADSFESLLNGIAEKQAQV
jgi:transaldolase